MAPDTIIGYVESIGTEEGGEIARTVCADCSDGEDVEGVLKESGVYGSDVPYPECNECGEVMRPSALESVKIEADPDELLDRLDVQCFPRLSTGQTEAETRTTEVRVRDTETGITEHYETVVIGEDHSRSEYRDIGREKFLEEHAQE